MKLRVRRMTSGAEGWVVDVGFVAGRRKQLQFNSKSEAEAKLALLTDVEKTFGRQGVERWFCAYEAGEEKPVCCVQEAWFEDARQALAILGGRANLVEAAKAFVAERVWDALPPELELIKDVVRPVAFPGGCGIYFLTQAQQVVYVGQSVDVLGRVAQHQREKFYSFEAAWWFAVHPEDLNRAERRWIQMLMPHRNVLWRNKTGRAR